MIKLAWKNITSNPFGSILSIGLVALSVGLVVFFAHVNRQFQQTMENNTAGVHLILAAKGSPLQSVLCNLYHVDNPTGNITVNEVKAFFNPKHPLIDKAIPLSIGDSYKSHRIVGTTKEIADLYHAKIASGKWWATSNEVVVGAQTAKELSLHIGDAFQSSHGLIEDGMDHTHEGDLVVVGILARTGSVLLFRRFGLFMMAIHMRKDRMIKMSMTTNTNTTMPVTRYKLMNGNNCFLSQIKRSLQCYSRLKTIIIKPSI